MLPPDIRIIRNVLRGHQTDMPPYTVTFVFSWHNFEDWNENNFHKKNFYFATSSHLACKDLTLLLHMLFPGFSFTLSLLDPWTHRVLRHADPREKLVSLEAALYVKYQNQEPSLHEQLLDEVVHFSGHSANSNHAELLPSVPDSLSDDLHGSAHSSSEREAGQPLVEVVRHDHEELWPPLPYALLHDLRGKAPSCSASKAEQPLVEVVSHDHEELWPPMPDALSHDLHGSAHLSSVREAGQPLDEVVSHDHEELWPPDAWSHDLYGSAPSSSVSEAGQPLVEVVSHDHEELWPPVPDALSHDLRGKAPSCSASEDGQPLSNDHVSLWPPMSGVFADVVHLVSRHGAEVLRAAGQPLVEIA